MSRRLRAIAIGLGAGCLLLVGFAGLEWYVWDIAIGQIGEPDRSMLFWGLPILLAALVALGLGAVLVAGVLHSLRDRKRQPPPRA